MNECTELSRTEIERLGRALVDTFQQLEAVLPLHAPRQLAHTLSELVILVLRYYQLALEEAEASEQDADSISGISAVFARFLSQLHKYCDMVQRHDPISFPTEILLPLRKILCDIGEYASEKMSFGIVDQASHNFNVTGITELIRRNCSLIRLYSGVETELDIGNIAHTCPEEFVILKYPAAEGRNVLSLTMLLHEVAHAIASKSGLFEQVAGEFYYADLMDSERLEITNSWLSECVADLVAARLFGPCTVLALRRLSLLTGSMEEFSKTHPSSRVRMGVAMEHLGRVGMEYLSTDDCTFSQRLRSWREYCSPALDSAPEEELWQKPFAAVFSAPNRETVHGIVEEHLGQLSFCVQEYATHVPRAVASLREGVPPIVHHKPHVIIATLFSAAWEILTQSPEGSLFEFAVARTQEERDEAVDAVHNLTLKGLEASFAAYHWEPSGSDQPEAPFPCTPDTIASVLSETSIRSRIRSDANPAGDIHIVPILEEGQISKCAIDLRLGTHFIVTKAGDVTHFSPSEMETSRIRQIASRVAKGLGYEFVIHPNRLVLGATLEYICLPLDTAALVLSRSCYGRLGLVVATATFVNPGWRGCLTLELANYSEVPIRLRCGEPVAQLILFSAEKLAHAPARSPRSGFCPIMPRFPEFKTEGFRSEDRNLRRFAEMLHQV